MKRSLGTVSLSDESTEGKKDSETCKASEDSTDDSSSIEIKKKASPKKIISESSSSEITSDSYTTYSTSDSSNEETKFKSKKKKSYKNKISMNSSLDSLYRRIKEEYINYHNYAKVHLKVLKKQYYPSKETKNIVVEKKKNPEKILREINIFGLPKVIFNYIQSNFLTLESLSTLGLTCKTFGKLIYQTYQDQYDNLEKRFKDLKKMLKKKAENLHFLVIHLIKDFKKFKYDLLKLILSANIHYISTSLPNFNIRPLKISRTNASNARPSFHLSLQLDLNFGILPNLPIFVSLNVTYYRNFSHFNLSSKYSSSNFVIFFFVNI